MTKMDVGGNGALSLQEYTAYGLRATTGVLAISRTIIEAHGGRIWAETPPGGGATFRLTLPIAKEAAAE